MDNKLKYQLLIGKVVDEIGLVKTTILLEEIKDAFTDPNECKHKYQRFGYPANGHQECIKCGKQIDY